MNTFIIEVLKEYISKCGIKILKESILNFIIYCAANVLIIGTLSEYKMCSELGTAWKIELLRLIFDKMGPMAFIRL